MGRWGINDRGLKEKQGLFTSRIQRFVQIIRWNNFKYGTANKFAKICIARYIQVARVEEFGAFVTFSYNGKEVKGFLERDEAKVGSAL